MCTWRFGVKVTKFEGVLNMVKYIFDYSTRPRRMR
jgi:hypothetical protein